MHELSVVENIVRTCDAYARSNNAEQVKFITVQIGLAGSVIPKYVRMYYDDVCEGTLLEGSELKIEEIEAEAFCRNCGNIFNPMKTRETCLKCNCSDYELIHGEELTIKEIGFI